jgi:cytochrome c-type biogenesis protein CcmH/NrfG
MFFMRLRRSTKPMFIFLALVFALSFVFLGVGSGSSGIGDLLRGNFNFGGGSSGPSIGKAKDRIAKNPNDAGAYKDLGTAYESKGQVDDAIDAYRRYVQLRPNDVSVLSKLGALYLNKGETLQRQAQVAQLDAQDVNPGALFAPGGKLGTALTPDPVTQAASSRANTAATTAFQNMQTTYRDALGVYRKLAQRSPKDPILQLQLANAAESASDTTTALAAYKRFVKLAPDDPSTPAIKARIKQLQASSPLGASNAG